MTTKVNITSIGNKDKSGSHHERPPGDEVIRAEKWRLRKIHKTKGSAFNGLALSGGGIRSASFSLGVLQALSHYGWLGGIHYLSTVSGGGYIGACLAYLLWAPNDNANLGADKHNFPLRTFPMAGRDETGGNGAPANDARETKEESEKKRQTEQKSGNNPEVSTFARRQTGGQSGGANSTKENPPCWEDGEVLRHLRKNANYLIPGNGHGWLSLSAVYLRNAAVSLFLFTGIVALVFGCLLWILQLSREEGLGYTITASSIIASVAFYVLTQNRFPSISGEDGKTPSSPPGHSISQETSVGLFFVVLAAAGLFIWKCVIPELPCYPSWIQCLGEDRFKYIVNLFTSADNRDPGSAAPILKPIVHMISLVFTSVMFILGTAIIYMGWSILVFSRGRFSFEHKSYAASKSKKQETGSGEETRFHAIRQLIEIAYTCVFGTTLGFLVFGSVPLVHQLISSQLPDKPLGLMISAIPSIAALFWQFHLSNKAQIRPTNRILTAAVQYLAVPMFLLLFLLVGLFIAQAIFSAPIDWPWTWCKWVRIELLVLVCLLFVLCPLNYLSIHRYYRDRLLATFMPHPRCSQASSPTELGLTDIFYKQYDLLSEKPEYSPPRWAPYPIFNANLILTDSKEARYRGRRGDNFILSPLYCGSEATGWKQTEHDPYFKELSLATVMGISGAAVSPNAGNNPSDPTTSWWVSTAMVLLNLRMGFWVPNPNTARKWLTFPCCLNTWLAGLLPGSHAEGNDWLELSDGGHFENLGLYELLRRRLKLIIAVDGAADPDYQFTDLGNAVEKARADFGHLIEFIDGTLDDLIPADEPHQTACPCDGIGWTRYAKRGYLIGRITYHKDDGQREEGRLIYLTTSFFRGLTPDLEAFRRTHKEFPDTPTSNQLFDERQFEAYRELGFQTAQKMIMDHGYLKPSSARYG